MFCLDSGHTTSCATANNKEIDRPFDNIHGGKLATLIFYTTHQSTAVIVNDKYEYGY